MSETESSKPEINQHPSVPDIVMLDPVLQDAIHAIPVDSRYVIALSGGLDSMALLWFSLSHLQRRSADIVVLHVHHGLNAAADEWADYCLGVCESLGVTATVERVVVSLAGQGLEAAARQVRYQVFESCLSTGGTLLQGHHQNDQAETVLMRLMRGAGPEGLAGIPQQRRLAAGQLYRPWLEIPRAVLLQQAEQFGLSWIEDDSNHDLHYDRNFIRHEVLPLLQSRWPAALGSLTRVSERAAQVHQQVSLWAGAQLDRLLSVHYQQDKALMLAPLADYSVQEQEILLRYWLDFQGVEHPSEATFERIWSEVIPADSAAQPELRWGANCLRRYQDCLFCLSNSALSDKAFEYKCQAPLSDEALAGVAGGSRVKLSLANGNDLTSEHEVLLRLPADGETIVICSRRGGESMRLPGSGLTKSLKKILQDKGVPPWRRASLPLIYYGDVLVSAGCIVIASGFAASIDQPALRVSCDR